jgi:hypothetical protein
MLLRQPNFPFRLILYKLTLLRNDNITRFTYMAQMRDNGKRGWTSFCNFRSGKMDNCAILEYYQKK